jgi:alkylation response protein AidB-like acyl-CoA dehydrogenase
MTEDLVLLEEQARRFLASELVPHVEKWTEDGIMERSTWNKLGQAGLLCAGIPEEFGGAGGSFAHETVINREIALAGLDALGAPLHSGIVAPYILNYGTDEQKKKWLPRLASGELIGAIAMSEPGTGSDLQGVRTSARKSGNGYVLNGSKTFITNGRVADVAVVMAVTDKAKGKKGISAFVVERGTPGFRAGKKEDKLGVRSSDTSELVLEDCRVPAENLLGEEGMGFVDTLRILDRGRIGIAAWSIGIAQAALEAASDYARGRRQFGHAIAEFQAVQFKLAEMATELDAARLLCWRAAARRDSGREHTIESSMAKLYAGEAAVKIALEAIQIHGGYGFIKEYPVERFLRDSKLGTIGEGTSEVQKLVIARGLLGLKGMVR